jgi:hypothetical protein
MTGIPAITDSAGGIFTMIPVVANNAEELGIRREEFKDSSLFFSRESWLNGQFMAYFLFIILKKPLINNALGKESRLA